MADMNAMSTQGQISLYSQGISSVAGLAANLFASRSLLAQGRYERGVARENAELNELYARLAVKGGEAAARERSRDGKALVGRQRSATAGQGLVVGEGTALALEMDAAADTAEDMQAIRTDARRQAFGYKMQAVNDRAAADGAMISARSAAGQNAITGGLQLGRDLLYGAAIYERYRPAPALLAETSPKVDGKIPESTYRAGSGRSAPAPAPIPAQLPESTFRFGGRRRNP